MADVLLRFASNSVPVPEDEATELARRLEAEPQGRGAADELRTHRRFADEAQKGLALSVINAWFHEVDASTLSDGMKDVRYELMRDLRLPPFEP
jgi:hypothetical protein